MNRRTDWACVAAWGVLAVVGVAFWAIVGAAL